MASTASGIEYPVAGDFIAPLNAHLQTLAETTQTALDNRAPLTSTSYTPTFTNLSLGNGTVVASYSKVGNIVVDDIFITFGSTTAVTGEIIITLPVSSIATNTAVICGNVNMVGPSSTWYSGVAFTQSATQIRLNAQNVVGVFYANYVGLSATVPFTWAVGHKISIRTVRLAA